MVNVIFALTRLPVFSIKYPEAFQVMQGMPVPQPSTLIGSLAYCLGVSRNMGLKAYSQVLKWVREGKILAARARLLSPQDRVLLPLTISAVILRRFRIVDKGFETKKKGEKKPVERLANALKNDNTLEVRKILEVELVDAFYREYVMGHEILCCWVLSEDLDVDYRWLNLIQRLGDSESLCSMLKVWQEECEVRESSDVEVNFPAPATGIEKIEYGNFMLVRICDEARELEPFIVPCEMKTEVKAGRRYPVLLPTKVKIKYVQPVKVCSTKYGDIVLRICKEEQEDRHG